MSYKATAIEFRYDDKFVVHRDSPDGPICSEYGYGSNKWTATIDETEHVVQHRPKPSNLLINQTALPAQHKTKAKVGFAYTMTGPTYGSRSCQYSPRIGGYSYQQRFVSDAVPFAHAAWTYPHTWWEMAMRAKIKGTAVNLAESIGEYGVAVAHWQDGVETIKRAAREAFQTYRDIRRGRWRRRRRTLREHGLDFIGADLAIKFGIIPNAELVYDSLQAIELAKVAGIYRRFIVTKSATSKGSYQTSVTNHDWEATRSQRAIAVMKYEPNSGAFTAGNPAESLWAIVPLSFMVDWFLDVGSYLASLDALSSVALVSGTITTRDRVVDRGTFKPGYIVEVEPLTSHHAFKRDLLTTIPMPPHPEWRPSATWGKLLSTFEILTTIKANIRR